MVDDFEALSPNMHQLTSLQDISQVDSWLETLFQCKQLDEDNVRRLCEKVMAHGGFSCLNYNTQ